MQDSRGKGLFGTLCVAPWPLDTAECTACPGQGPAGHRSSPVNTKDKKCWFTFWCSRPPPTPHCLAGWDTQSKR